MEYEALKVGALLHDIGKWYKLVKNDEDGRHIKYGVKIMIMKCPSCTGFKLFGCRLPNIM